VKLSILVPFRDADGSRTRAKDWIVRRWAHYWPDAEIIEAADDGVDPFNKALAVNNAAARATGDIYIILDADTWIDPAHITRALGEIESGRAKWVVPATRSLRLKQDISNQLMALDPTGPLPPIQVHHAEQRGLVAGFCWVVPAELWWRSAWYNEDGERRGMDERIRGWGGEDTLWTWVLDTMSQRRHARLAATLMCLWHERPRQAGLGRIWQGQDRSGKDEAAKRALLQVYAKSRRPDVLAKVLNQ
jgi:hypothetical protein